MQRFTSKLTVKFLEGKRGTAQISPRNFHRLELSSFVFNTYFIVAIYLR